jgi:phosphoglycerol transferase MdoB-like AlkP superfamily enzyme
MKKRLMALFGYAIFWMVFFWFARLYFIIFQHHIAFQENVSGLLATFLHGSKLDISTTGYYLILPFLLAIPSLYFNGRWYRICMRCYTYFFVIFSAVIVVADANLYSYWGFRMDYTPVLYLKTPGEALASVNNLTLILLFLAAAVLSAVFIYGYRRFIDKLFVFPEKVKMILLGIFLFLILTAALIIPIRGGFGIAPINAGTVYFSPKMFLNHSAVNAVWNVGTSAFTQKPLKNPYVYTSADQAAVKFKSLFSGEKSETYKVLNTDRPNILLIALESFSGYLIGPLGGDSLVTPSMNRYAKEGILFTEFYASGTRTDKAFPAILNGYPAQPAQSIIKEPAKTQSLPGLAGILIDNGYSSSFWYGGEINFANFNSFVIGSGFRSIVTKSNFHASDFNSKWGVHDHILFKAFQDSMKSPREPFFNVVLSLSSHEPFDVPMEPVFKGNDMMTSYKNSVFYADSVIGNFLGWAKNQEWWKNTLVVLVADHGARVNPETAAYASEIFRIPMIWTGGALSVKGLRISKLSGQVDIPLTILQQMGIEADFPFGKDIFSDGSASFAFYTFNEGFGFLTDSSRCIFDQKLGEAVVMEGKNPEAAEEYGKAYLQVLFDDYLKR